MALTILHTFQSQKSDGSDSTQIQPSNWNDTHDISGDVDETMLSFSNVTTANVSTSHHGLAPQLPGSSLVFLDGTGNYSTPHIQAVNTVGFSSSPNFDLSLGGIQTITLTGNVGSSTLGNVTTGQTVTFFIIQDATGGRSFTWPANVFGGIDVSSGTAHQHGIQSFVSADGMNLYALGIGVIV